MDELLQAISQYPNGTVLVIEWDRGIKIKAELDTIYEADNGLEEDEEGYQEYYAAIVKVLYAL